MKYDENKLKELPIKNQFRMRGTDPTRLETFIDAAFAFAVSMLVISVGDIPKNYPELIIALKGVPAFAASFASVAVFWIGHRKWSRYYGLENGTTILISLILIFVMMVYVYPLRLMFSSLFSWITNNWLPTEFILSQRFELIALFIIYGIGFWLMSGLMALLYIKAKSLKNDLCLNKSEIILTNYEIASWLTLSLTGLASAIYAWVIPTNLDVFAGFVYLTLPISMTTISIYYMKKL